MAGELIGALRVALGWDTAEFTAGSKKARAEAKATATDIQGTLSGLKSAVTGLATGVVATAIVAAGKRALDYASSLDEVSQQLGVTSKDLQVYRYAASQAGISQDEMDAGLAKLTKSIGEADAGAKVQATTFRDLGISMHDANGNLKTAGDILPQLTAALSTIKDPATRARIETELLGKAGQKLDTLLAGGTDALDGLRKAAEDLGIVLSRDQIENADKAADKLSEVKQVLEARIAGVVADNAGAIFKLADALETLIGKLGGAADAYKRFKLEATASLSDLSAKGNFALGMTREGVADQQRAATARKQLADMDSQSRFDAMNKAFPIPGAKSKLASNGALPTVKGEADAAAKAAEAARQKALRQEDKFQSDLARASDEFLGLKQQLTTDARTQAMYQHEQVDRDAAARDRDLDLAVAEKQITATAATELKARGEQNDVLKHSIINRELDAKLDQQELDAKLAGIDNQRDLLGAQEALVKTAGERRDIELRLLDLQYQEERARLEATLASKQATDAEKAIAQKRLDALVDLQKVQAEGVRRNTRGPGETYLDSLSKTTAEIGESIEGTAVSALEKFNTELDDSVKKALGLHGVLGDIVGDLIDMAIKQALIKPLAQSLFGGSSGGGGFFGGLTKLLGIGGASQDFGFSGSGTIASSNVLNLGSNIAGLASGGTIGGFSGIDRNLLSINGAPVARVGRGEMLTVTPENDNGRRGGSFHFHLEGAVVTQDLLNQMNAIGQAATVGGAGLALSTSSAKARRRLA